MVDTNNSRIERIIKTIESRFSDELSTLRSLVSMQNIVADVVNESKHPQPPKTAPAGHSRDSKFPNGGSAKKTPRKKTPTREVKKTPPKEVKKQLAKEEKKVPSHKEGKKEQKKEEKKVPRKDGKKEEKKVSKRPSTVKDTKKDTKKEEKKQKQEQKKISHEKSGEKRILPEDKKEPGIPPVVVEKTLPTEEIKKEAAQPVVQGEKPAPVVVTQEKKVEEATAPMVGQAGLLFELAPEAPEIKPIEKKAEEKEEVKSSSAALLKDINIGLEALKKSAPYLFE